MKDNFTPKQVAKAIRVSESSVKRWCDKGVIHTQYTAGGHRRIPMAGLVSFLRNSKYELASPDVLGLPTNTGQTHRMIDRAAGQFLEAMVEGDEQRCRTIMLDLYLAEYSIDSICDQVFAPALHRVGDLWECGEAEVYQERRGCHICHRLLHELRLLTMPAGLDAPLAIGGTPFADPYNLATTMAELVLRDNRWQATSLGENLPFATMEAAIRHHQPKLFWLSVSHLEHADQFLEGYAAFYENVHDVVRIAVGGKALTQPVLAQMDYMVYCESMQRLEKFAEGLLQSLPMSK